MRSIKFHFLAPVWGEAYTDVFLKAALPSHLAPNNLGAFDRNVDKYKIYTTSKDAITIQQSPVYSKLTETIETEIHFIDDYIKEYGNKYDLFALCHSLGIKEAVEDDTALVFLGADFFFSDGSFANMRKMAMAGKRAVIITGYRVTKTFWPQFVETSYSERDGCISISPRELVKVSLPHIHPQSKALFWDSPSFHGWPACLYWNVPGEGIIVRGAHLMPLMINPVMRDQSLTPGEGMAIDGNDYLMRAVPDYSNVYIVEDSDEIAYLSFEHQQSDYPNPPPNKSSITEVALWIKEHCVPYFINYLNAKIRYHVSDPSSQWEKVEQTSDEVIDSIRACLEFYESVPNAHKELEEHKNQLSALAATVRNLLIDNAQVHNKLGEELCKAGSAQEAEEALQKALSLVPNLAITHANLAILHWKGNRIEEAIKHIRHAIQLEPQNRDVISKSIMILEALDQVESAIQLADQYLKNNTDNEIQAKLERMHLT